MIRNKLCDLTFNKRGSQFTEAAIVIPVMILAAMLMLRMFTFYLEILTTGISGHREALKEQQAYRGASIRLYKKTEKVIMFKGGLLKMDVSKTLDTKAYLINEDFLVRSGEVLN